MTPELLKFYAACYTDHLEDPLCSPLFGDLKGCRRRCCSWAGTRSCSTTRGCCTKSCWPRAAGAGFIIAPERWHAYVLYYLNENMSDFDTINQFMTKCALPGEEAAVDAAGQRREDLPRGQAAQLDELLPPLRHADRAGRRAGAARGAGRDGAALPVDRGAAAPGRVLVLSRGDQQGSRHRGGQELPARPRAVRRRAQCAFRVLVYINRMAVEFFSTP